MQKSEIQSKITIDDLALMINKGFVEQAKNLNDFKKGMYSFQSVVYSKFDAIDRKFDVVDSRFDRLENMFVTLEKTVISDHGRRIRKLEAKVLTA